MVGFDSTPTPRPTWARFRLEERLSFVKLTRHLSRRLLLSLVESRS